MLSGATSRAFDITGTAVFRIVVSSDSIKNATATSHGKSCLREAAGRGKEVLMILSEAKVICFDAEPCSINAQSGSNRCGGIPDWYRGRSTLYDECSSGIPTGGG